MRRQVTNEEFNAVVHLTRTTKLDSSFDLITFNSTEDKWIDYDDNEKIKSLKWGFEILREAISYPLAHDGLDADEAKLVVGLLKEFTKISDDEARWMLSREED